MVYKNVTFQISENAYNWIYIYIYIYIYISRKSGNISSHTEKLFSSDTRQSMKRRIATERISKIYIARCGYTWLDESKWPQEWPISPITIIYLKILSEKMKSFCLHKTGF